MIKKYYHATLKTNKSFGKNIFGAKAFACLQLAERLLKSYENILKAKVKSIEQSL